MQHYIQDRKPKVGRPHFLVPYQRIFCNTLAKYSLSDNLCPVLILFIVFSKVLRIIFPEASPSTNIQDLVQAALAYCQLLSSAWILESKLFWKPSQTLKQLSTVEYKAGQWNILHVYTSMETLNVLPTTSIGVCQLLWNWIWYRGNSVAALKSHILVWDQLRHSQDERT